MGRIGKFLQTYHHMYILNRILFVPESNGGVAGEVELLPADWPW